MFSVSINDVHADALSLKRGSFGAPHGCCSSPPARTEQ